MHTVDISIIGAYLFGVVVAAAYFARRASKNLDSYFLGGKSIPWYVLGVSNASSCLRHRGHDVAGLHHFYLRTQKALGSMGMADLCPDFYDGLSGPVDSTVECVDGRRMNDDTFRLVAKWRALPG